MPTADPVHGTLGDDGEIGVDAGGESLVGSNLSRVVCGDSEAAVG